MIQPIALALSPPFTVDGCNTDPLFAIGKDSKGKTVQVLSMYRRPRIAANLPYVATTRSDMGVDPPVPNDPVTGQPFAVGTPPTSIDPSTGRPISGNIMWDGREPTLEHQAIAATRGHAQALNPPTSTQVAQMVQFERGIFSAQLWDAWALQLTLPALTVALRSSQGLAWTAGANRTRALSTVPITAPPPATSNATFPLFDRWAALAATSERGAQRQSVPAGKPSFRRVSLLSTASLA